MQQGQEYSTYWNGNVPVHPPSPSVLVDTVNVRTYISLNNQLKRILVLFDGCRINIVNVASISISISIFISISIIIQRWIFRLMWLCYVCHTISKTKSFWLTLLCAKSNFKFEELNYSSTSSASSSSARNEEKVLSP